MDTLLDWIVSILPFAGGVYLTVKPTKHIGWRLIAFGLAVSILTFVQLDRSRKSHEKELHDTTSQLEQTSQSLGKLSTLLDQYMASRNSGEEAKVLGAAVKQALQESQKAAKPNIPSSVTATAH